MAALDLGRIQQRDGRWVIVDLEGKGKRVRTVPVPAWVKVAIDAWTAVAGLADGLQEHAEACGLPAIAPHDLRRTCAKLCRAARGELEQIQMLLGHASIQTTERYLGSRQDLADAPNDRIGLKLVPI